MNEIYERYQWLSAMHEKTINAFEIYENKKDDFVLRELLDEWRNSFICSEYNEGFILQKEPSTIEQEFRDAYSPIILSKEYIDKINNDVIQYIYIHTNDDIIEQDMALLISRLLYNCQLLEKCFFPLLKNKYKNHIEKVLNQLNVCIVVSQLEYFSEYFRYIVLEFNDEFMSIKEASAHIFHVVGVLNFKCHNYEQVIECFKHAVNRFQIEFSSNAYKNDEYFQTRLLLAYCYEYNHQFESAIMELIGLDVDSLIKIFKDSNFSMFDLFDESDIDRAKIWSKNFIYNTLKRNIIDKNKNSLFEIADKRDTLNNSIIGDLHEILHSLAHCLNELGIKWKIEESENKNSVIHLLSISRAIMLYVAECNPKCLDFQSCLYMIFGEAKDYDVCLRRINELIDRYEKSNIKNINYEMENMFYLFLISNQSNKTIIDDSIAQKAKDAYDKFVNFAKRRYDYDALIHIEIFRFRFEIVQVLRSSVNNSQIEKKLISLKTESTGKNIFSIKPSSKVNKWIIQEYNKSIALYEFLVKYFNDEPEININELYNFASRFNFYRNFFQTNKNGLKKDSAIFDVINSIIDDFVSPQSIFILAPVTSALPYQHQTKNLSKLEKSIFSVEKLRIKADKKMEYFANINNINFGMRNTSILNWLFQRKDYNVAFIAFKYDLDVSFDKYYFCLNETEIFERPIVNVEKLNQLIMNVDRSDKKHSVCKNGQTKCCTTFVKNKQQINEICAELLLPFEKYYNKYFLFFYKGNIARSMNHTWYIIALNCELNELQIEEITLYLCGYELEPKLKLALAYQNYCFVSFDILDSSLAINDLLQLQEDYNFRFWYNKELLEGEKSNDDVLLRIDNANCVMFFISHNSIINEGSEIYQEIVYAMDKKKKCIVVSVNCSKKIEFENLLREKVEKNTRYENVLLYLTSDDTILVFRNQRELNYRKHIYDEKKLLSGLRKLGVLRDEQ